MVWGRIARSSPRPGFRLEFPDWVPFSAKPVEPPFGVGPTRDIFGPLGPPGPPVASPRIWQPTDNPFVVLPPAVAEPVERASRVVPGYSEIAPLVERLGVPPTFTQPSPFADAPIPPPTRFAQQRKFVGYDEFDSPMFENVLEPRSATPWMQRTGQNYETGKKYAPGEGPAAPRWWVRQQDAAGPGFDKEFEWLALRDSQSGDRVAVELFDRSGKRMVVPTANLDPSDPTQVFVFGSNLEGIHGAGAAKAAAQSWGAERGVGKGLTGRAYAFPTKRTPSQETRQFDLFEIENFFDEFLDVARINPDKKFMFTPVGSGLAGYELEEIATLIARAASQKQLPKNIYFVDITPEKTNEFVAAIARARNKIGDSVVYVDVDDLIELEKRFFGSAGIGTAPKRVQDLELPALPAPSILKYADPSAGASPGTFQVSKIVQDVVRSGDDAAIAVMQALTLRRLQYAKNPRALISALRDYKHLEPTIKKTGPMRIGFRDAIEVKMDQLGALNKKAAADTYVYLAEEVIDARKLASYIEGYVSEAKTFEELLLARYWIDDAFVASKLSHPELIARNEWSRTELRIVSQIEDRIDNLRTQAKRYNKPQGEDLVVIRGDMSEKELREMFTQAIGTVRSLDELRLINGIINKLEVPASLREDFNVMIRSVRPLVSQRRAVPVRDKDLRRTRIEQVSGSIDSPSDPSAAEPRALRRGTYMAGEEPMFRDIAGWEEGGRAFTYQPYNPETMLAKATENQKRWVVEQSTDFVKRVRSTLDIDELRSLYVRALDLRDKGLLSGRMWKFLEREMNARNGVIQARYKRTGIVPASELAKEKPKMDVTSLVDWAKQNSAARRSATRYWNDPDVARRDDLSDFVQPNREYEGILYDSQLRGDFAARRMTHGDSYYDTDMFFDSMLAFDDKLGDISVLRGDISDEIIRNTNRRYWEITDSINSIEEVLEKGVDYLGRNIDETMITRTTKKGEPRTVTVRQNFEDRRRALIVERNKVDVSDMSYYDDQNSPFFPFGTRRVVDPTDPLESKIQMFDFEQGVWFDADYEMLAAARASNKATARYTEAIFPEVKDFTLVYESAPRRYVNTTVFTEGAPSTFEARPLVRMYVPDGEGYQYRTFINAYGSDATVAVAANFDSPGERLTKSFANGSVLRYDKEKGYYAATKGVGKRTRYIDVQHDSTDFNAEVNKVVDQLNEAYRLKNDNPITVNFAGNSLDSLGGAAQKTADEYAMRLMQAVMEHPQRRFIIANARSGGQSGYDQAFMKALLRLDIPTDITLPRAKFGNKVMVQGVDGSTEYVTVEQYLRGLGFSRPPVASELKPLRQAVSRTLDEAPWGRYSEGQPFFEVSTKAEPAGRAYSAFNARIKGRGNKSIEDLYQIDVKGGEKISPGRYTKKGSAYDGPLSHDELYAEYKNLWREFFAENPDKLTEIAELTRGKKITDQFASSDISQARVIHEILAENGLRVLR